MAENYGTLEGTLDEHGVLSGEMSDRATLEGEIQFGSGGGGVLDVFQNGQSVVQGRYAYVTVPTFLRELRSDDYHNTVTSLEIQNWNGKADPSDIPTALSQLDNDANFVQDADYVHTDNNFTDEDKAAIGNIPENITDLSDVAVDNIQNGQVLKWDATQEKFVNADESGGSGDVTDVKVDGTSVVDPVTGEADIDLSGKADKALDAVAGDFAVLLANGNYANSGKSANDMASKAEMSVNTSGTQTTVQLKNGTSATINNPTITIQKNGQNVDSFTLNQDSNKAINIAVPTKTSDLQNDNSFITNTVNNLANYYLKTQTYTQAEVDALIDAAINGRFHKVNVLPATGEPNVIYLVPKATPETSNACDEYIWQDNAWELIGSTNIDLSGYVTDDELNTALADYLTTSAFNTAIANYYTKTEVGNLLDGKVDKVSGKGLSTYDYDATAKGIVDSVTTNLAGKVDKVNGKGLSTEDYTTTEKNKLAGISTGANKVESSTTNGNIKIDGTETQVYDGSGKVDKVNGKGLSTNDYDNTDKAKVDMIDNTTTSATGNPISIADLKSAQIALNPVITYNPIQDLHGQSKPYPAGGGKNKLNYAGTSQSINGVMFTFNSDGSVKAHGLATANAILSISYDLSFDYDCILSGSPTGGSVSTYQLDANGATYSDTGNGVTIPANTQIVNVRIRINNGYNANNLMFYPMIRKATESDSSFAPYSNICPISGYDKIEVLSCGKNILRNEKYDNGAGSVLIGTNTNDDRHNYILNPGTYTYNITVTKNMAYYYGINGGSSIQITSLPFTFTVNEKSKYRFWVFGAGVTASDITSFQLEENNQATTYEPYHKTTDLSESLGQTVYGLTHEVRTGKARVTYGYKDLGDLTWTYQGDYLFTADDSSIKIEGLAVCSCYQRASNYPALISTDKSFWIHDRYNRIVIHDTSYADATAFKTAVTGQKLAYQLATPTEIQLTPHEIALSQGYNYISTNGTSISLAYHNGEMARLADVSQLGETLNALEDKVSANDAGTQVNLMTYNTSTNKYVCPSDGYITLSNAGASVGDYIIISVYGANDNAICGLRCDTPIASMITVQNLFVKRGMKCYVRATSSTGSFTALFTPLA